jgi:hypothetical protein
LARRLPTLPLRAVNQRSVSCVGRENAAEIALPGRPAQELVMR